MSGAMEHVKKYLAVYCTLTMIVALILSKVYRTKIPYFGYIVTAIAFLMIFPMMVYLRIERIKEIARDPKALLMNLFYAFVVTPLILVLIVKYVHEEFVIGLLINMLIPGPSLSITLTALSDGDIELASIAMAVNFILVPVLLPIELYLISGIVGVHVPIYLVIRALVFILILPVIVGQSLRRYILKTRDHETLARMKPKFSSLSVTGMFLMILLVFYQKGPIILKLRREFILLIGRVLAYLAIMGVIVTVLDLLLLSYREHAAISYIVLGKNNSLAVAITSIYFKGLAVVAPIAYGLVQSVVLPSYVRVNLYLKRFFKRI